LCTDYRQGECLGRGWWWRELKEANKPPAGQNKQKRHRKQLISCLLGLKIAYPPFFAQKYLIRYTPKMFFEESINFFFHKALWSYTCSKFQESYTPPAIRMRVKEDNVRQTTRRGLIGFFLISSSFGCTP
jgi:hypothetical protein